MNFGDLLDRIRTHETSRAKRASPFQTHSFCGGFLKANKKHAGSCGQSVALAQWHSPSGLVRVEVVLGSLAQKTIFHLKKSCCSCWFSHSLQLGGNATGLAQNSEEKRKPKLTGSRDINLWLQTQCWGTTHHTRVCMVHPKSDVHPSPDCREGQHTESRTLTLCLYFDSGLFWSSTSHMQHFILLSEASCGRVSAQIN